LVTHATEKYKKPRNHNTIIIETDEHMHIRTMISTATPLAVFVKIFTILILLSGSTHLYAQSDKAAGEKALVDWALRYKSARPIGTDADALFDIRTMKFLDISLDPELRAFLPPSTVAGAFQESLQGVGVTVTQDSPYLLSVSVEGVWLRDTYSFLCTVEVLQNVVIERESHFRVVPVTIWGKTVIGTADRVKVESNVKELVGGRLRMLVNDFRVVRGKSSPGANSPVR
jgi:hypothetical protein